LRRPEDANEKRLKHALLLQLSKMKQMKVPLTRDFTMEDSIDDIQFEIDHQENNTAVINAVNMGKGIIGVGFNVLELGNNRIGPFLNLSGLGQSACVNMDRYNGPLEKIYRKYFRKHAQNPIQELLFLIGGTIVMTHLGNKGGPLIKALLTMFLGGGSGGGNSAQTINDAAKAFKSQSTPPSAPPETAFTQRGYDPRNVPPPTFAAPSAPPAPPSTTRKTLRRPGFSDGGGGGAQYFIPPQPQQPQAPTPSVQIPAPPTTAPVPPPPKPVLVPPPQPPPPIRHPPTPATVLVFPLAGTPVRGNIRRGDTETHMSLPTVIEEIVEETKPKLADAVVVEPDEDDHEDLSSTAFETLMREVLAEDEEKEEVKM